MPSLAELIQQLYADATDPASPCFLPTVILEQTLPAEPLAIADVDWGSLSGISPELPDALCAAISPGTICTPQTSATLTLTQLQIVGLSNVVPSPPTVNGTEVSGTFRFGGVSKLPPGVTVPPGLVIEGAFAIALSCCASSDGRTCAGPPAPQSVTGTFTVRLTGAVLAMTLDVSLTAAVSDPVTVTVKALSLTADQVTFAFQTSSPGPHVGTFNALLRDAFNRTGGPALLKTINERLGEASVLTALGSLLTGVFSSQADPGLLAFVVSLLHDAAGDPSGQYYLPNQIKQATNPVLDPFAAGGADLGDVGAWRPGAGGIICAGIGGGHIPPDIQAPGSKVPLHLDHISISGTSNLTALPALVVGDSIYAMVACNAVVGWPATLTISGGFDLTVTCCTTSDQRSCAGGPQDNTGSGTFQATVANAMVGIKATISAPGGKQLVVTADALYFRCDPNVVNPGNIKIAINITSIPRGPVREDWNTEAMGVFNSPQAASAMVTEISARLNQQAVRDRLSEVATQAIQSLLKQDTVLARRVMDEVEARHRHER